jgi:hypothetical protein
LKRTIGERRHDLGPQHARVRAVKLCVVAITNGKRASVAPPIAKADDKMVLVDGHCSISRAPRGH